MHYSLLSLLRHSVSGHRTWAPAWREPDPKPAYVIVIVGAGHGLATAYYLAKEHGFKSTAVLEKSWLGSGRIGHAQDHAAQGRRRRGVDRGRRGMEDGRALPRQALPDLQDLLRTLDGLLDDLKKIDTDVIAISGDPQDKAETEVTSRPIILRYARC